MDSVQEARRGEAAEQLMANPLLAEAFSEIEKRLVSQLAQIEITRDRAEYLRQLLVANRKIKQYLENVAAGGKIAALEIESRTRSQQWIDKARYSIMG